MFHMMTFVLVDGCESLAMHLDPTVLQQIPSIREAQTLYYIFRVLIAQRRSVDGKENDLGGIQGPGRCGSQGFRIDIKDFPRRTDSQRCEQHNIVRGMNLSNLVRFDFSGKSRVFVVHTVQDAQRLSTEKVSTHDIAIHVLPILKRAIWISLTIIWMGGGWVAAAGEATVAAEGTGHLTFDFKAHISCFLLDHAQSFLVRHSQPHLHLVCFRRIGGKTRVDLMATPTAQYNFETQKPSEGNVIHQIPISIPLQQFSGQMVHHERIAMIGNITRRPAKHLDKGR
mmetsp:Transcript_23075/g.41645  ORF Transcript_23075/g.41645 Transcript_23075/m.41645 type:complete len:283 (-) Transcript_23075:631-1479(-)